MKLLEPAVISNIQNLTDLHPNILGLVAVILFIAIYGILRKIIQHVFTERKEILLLFLLNLLTLYVVLGFIATYFSETPWLFEPFVTIGNASISLFLLFTALFIFILGFKTSAILKSYVLPDVYNKYNIETSFRYTFNSISHYVVILIALLISLTTLGINLSSLSVFAGVIGVGIGFGMQNIASNFISGIILLFERPIKVGDRVIIDDIIGDVDEIKMRATIVRTLDNERIIIPNSFFLEEKVINRSYHDTRLRLIVDVGVSYGSDVALVEQLLLQSVADISDDWDCILTDPPSLVHFIDFGDSSLDFRLLLWINDPEKEFRIKSDLRFKILENFRSNNVEIPFPQRDLHMISQ